MSDIWLCYNTTWLYIKFYNFKFKIEHATIVQINKI